MSASIRRAEMRDMQEVLRLLSQIGELHQKGRPDVYRANAAKYNAEQYRSIIENPDTPVFVAEVGGRLAGYVFCQLQVRSGHPQLCDMRTLYVDDLCVDESLRGHHVGSALMDAARDCAREMGCHNLVLNVWEFNESARAFYEHYGMHTMRRYMEIVL